MTRFFLLGKNANKIPANMMENVISKMAQKLAIAKEPAMKDLLVKPKLIQLAGVVNMEIAMRTMAFNVFAMTVMKAPIAKMTRMNAP